MTAIFGKTLRRVRAHAGRSPLARPEFDAPASVIVTSAAFTDRGPMPASSGGKGVGGDVSPPLRWTGAPDDAKQLVLIMDDVDVPLPKPLFHSIALLEPDVESLGEGEFHHSTPGLRIIATALGRHGYSGPRPIPGHGPHHYRFHVLALDRRITDDVTSARRLLEAIAGHVAARGTLTGTYER